RSQDRAGRGRAAPISPPVPTDGARPLPCAAAARVPLAPGGRGCRGTTVAPVSWAPQSDIRPHSLQGARSRCKGATGKDYPCRQVFGRRHVILLRTKAGESSSIAVSASPGSLATPVF